MIIKKINELADIRKRHQKEKIVYCSGSFDLTHVGHVLFFEDCRKYGDMLVVGVGGDRNIRLLKGVGRPILSESVRLKMVDSLKPVDYVFLDTVHSAKNPLEPLRQYFKALKPNIWVVNNDAYDIPSRHKIAQEHNVKLVVLKRWCPSAFKKISTSNLIRHIKNMQE